MKKVYLPLFLCFAALQGIAQKRHITPQAPTFVVAAVYSSNASYYGQSPEEKLPYLLTNASARFPGGLWLSAGAYKLINFGPGISAVDASLGFEMTLNKAETLTGDISYSRSFYPDNSPLLQAANENSFNITVNHSWNWLNTSLSTDYAFGQESDFFLSFSNSRSIEIGSFTESDLISLEPAIEVVAGTQHFYETYTTKEKNTKNKGKGKNDEKPGKGNTTVTTTVSKSSFELLTYNIKIPFTYSRPNYMIEAGYQLSILGAKADAVSKRPHTFFNLGFYYLF